MEMLKYLKLEVEVKFAGWYLTMDKVQCGQQQVDLDRPEHES